MTNQPEPGDRARALALLEAAEFMRDAHFRDGLTVQEITTALAHTVDRADAMVGSLARDGFGAVEIAEMLSADAPAVSSAVVAPPTDQTALRDRIAEALMRWAERGNSPQYAAMRRPETVRANAYSRADAVLAVLPTTDRAAVLRDAIDLAREEAHRLEEEVGIEAARGARCVAYLLRKRLAKEQPLRRLADQAQPEPGARHVHITIRHPDPTTAHTAALCIADLIHAEYGDSLNLAITTDAARQDGAQQS